MNIPGRGPIFGCEEVPWTAECERISRIPREGWSEEASAKLAVSMTEELKTPQGTMHLRPVQAVLLYEAMRCGGVFGPIRVGGGKCLGAKTLVLMWNGTTKKVEDITAGDVVMGPDSGPRFVTSTCRGREMLYRVTPVKGESYVVNESHILSVRQTAMKKGSKYSCERGGRIRNLSVKEYLGESEHFRDNWKGYRTGVDFRSVNVRDPYMMGLWLGDGNTDNFAITTADPETAVEIYAFAKRNELSIRIAKRENNASSTYYVSTGTLLGDKGRNSALEWLREEKVLSNKHVPHYYKVNSRHVRLETLAGLLDSDGHLTENGTFDFISALEVLADDVCFLSRSLGLAAYKKKCEKECVNNGVWGTYYRVCISGELSEIPCRIQRKKALVRGQKKSVLMTGISVEPIGEGEYYGFELAGADRRFLLGDFTVTHNTLCSLLLPLVLEAKRPILLLPAGLIEKTWHDRKILAEHWKLPTNLQIISYEMLGRVNAAERLMYVEPDLIIADECHRLKGKKAGCTRRVTRFMKEHPQTKFAAMSGTVMKASLKDFAHILTWCLKDGAPVPRTEDEISMWSDALDEKVNPMARRRPGALLRL